MISTMNNKFQIDTQIGDLKSKMIIYKFTNLINNKIYFGQTITTLSQRLHMYLREIQNPKDNRPVIQAFRKYGTTNFKLEIIKICGSIEELNISEEQLITEHNSMDNTIGYNLQFGGFNKVVHEDTKILLREKCSGWTHTEEAKQKISDRMSGENHPLFGKKMSEEHCKKCSDAHIGQVAWNKGLKTGPLSDNHKNKMRNVMKGRDITWGDKITESKTKFHRQDIIKFLSENLHINRKQLEQQFNIKSTITIHKMGGFKQLKKEAELLKIKKIEVGEEI